MQNVLPKAGRFLLYMLYLRNLPITNQNNYASF